MLTSNHSLIRFRRDGRITRAIPDRLTQKTHAHYDAYATSMFAVYKSGIGKTRGELHSAIEKIFANEADCPPRRIQSFKKLLDEVSDYHTDQNGDAAALRIKVFSLAAKYHPASENPDTLFSHSLEEVHKIISQTIGKPWPEIEASLYRDVIDAQPLRAFKGYETTSDFLGRYNIAQTQTLLYRARCLTVEAHDHFKIILRQAKLAGLMHRITRLGASHFRIQFDGPASIIRNTRKYGIQMATFLPSLLACENWQARAELKTPWGQKGSPEAIFEFSDRDGLHVKSTMTEAFDSKLEEAFAKRFGEERNGWHLIREGEILHKDQHVFFPDFSFRHNDGTIAMLEIVGFWTPDYLSHKREVISRFRSENLILAVAESNLKEDASIPEDFITYKTVIKIDRILEALEKIRKRNPNKTPAPTLTLRDYQTQCLDRILEKYRSGVHRQLVCLPTGTGKTVIFSSFPRHFKMKKKMLVLAHRAELLNQARDKIQAANPDLSVQIECGKQTIRPDCDIVVASVPTIGRAGSARLAKLDPTDFNLIVVDEAHHATATTYGRIFDHFGLFNPTSTKLLVGFTATPRRGDGTGLDEVFEEIVFSSALPEMIRDGFLSSVRGLRIETKVDLRKVKSRMGDFVVNDLARAVNVEARNDLLLKVYQKYLSARPTLCFCVDVAHTHAVASQFNAAGIATGAVTGDMALADRQEMLHAFHKGELKVLANCMVLTEGYDEPSIAGILLGRPTKSHLLYTQMIGRGTRLAPGKKDLLVIDIADLTRTQEIASLSRMFGLSGTFNMEGKDAPTIQAALDWTREHRPWVNVEVATSLSNLRYHCEHIDLLSLDIPPELDELAEFSWSHAGHEIYQLGLGKGDVFTVSPTILNHWEIVLSHYGQIQHQKTVPELNEAIVTCEKFVEEKRPDAIGLVIRNSSWRHAPASEKQVHLLKKYQLEIPKSITKGQASHLIGMLG